MASKLQFTQNKVTSNDLLDEMNGVKTTPEKLTKVDLKSEPATDTTASNDKTLITAKIQTSTIKDWKHFCIKQDLSLTALIKKAVNRYIKDVENGKIEL